MTNMDCDERNGEDTSVAIPPQAISTNNEKFDNYHPASCNSAVALPVPNKMVTNKMDPVSCAWCQKPIYDQYYMWVDKRFWHESCVQCNACQTPLSKSCFAKNQKLYCTQDYKQLQKCRRCMEYIPLSDYVIYVNSNPYHVHCFSCDFCQKKLQTGDQYLIDEPNNQIYCKSCGNQAGHVVTTSHLDQEIDSISDSDISDDDMFISRTSIPGMRYMPNYGVPSGMHHNHMMMQAKNGHKSILSSLSSCDGKGRVKRPRTILTTAQRRKFKASFEVSQKPCRKVRETLAAETGLSPRVVQVWFQNQRAKMKKIARRQSDGVGQNKCRNGSKSSRKKTLDSDSDNELSSPGSYISMPTTPHQGALFNDSYRSPTSIQTSPTTSISELNSYSHSTSNQLHGCDSFKDTTADFLYDDFETNFLSGSDAYVTQTMASSAHAPALNVETRFQSDDLSISHEFNNSGSLVTINGDVLPDSSPQDPFQNFGTLQTLTPFPNQVQNETNPIDRLMCMQSTFFRT